MTPKDGAHYAPGQTPDRPWQAFADGKPLREGRKIRRFRTEVKALRAVISHKANSLLQALSSWKF